MPTKFVLRTLLLGAVWLLYQNFNFVDPFPAKAQSAKAGVCLDHSLSNLTPSPSPEKWAGADFKLQTLNFKLPPPYKIKTVVLDAGHGGKDPGCLGASRTEAHNEKHNTLAIVLKLGALIEANYPDVKVVYTRDTDVFVELNERAAIANRLKADLFISVHCNALSVSSAKGTETYVMGLHTAKHNLEVAKRENASIYLEENYEKNYEGYDPNSPEAHIIGSVYQSAYLEQSILLASLVQHYAEATAERENRGVKQAGFLVLRETAMPAVLVESGYLTNRVEEAFLASDEGRGKIAKAIFEGFEAYKTQLETGKKIELKPIAAKPKAKQPMPEAAVAAKKDPVPSSKSPTTKSPDKAADQPVQVKPVQAKPGPSTVLVKKIEPTPSTTYRIHLMTWATKVDRNTGQMGLISGVKEEHLDGQYHYFTSTFATRKEAEELLSDIKNLGFRTAKVVEVGRTP